MKHHGQWIKRFYRVVGYRVALALRHTPISANLVTASRFVWIALASWLLLARDPGPWWWLAAFLVFLFAMLDAADGSLAKMTRTSRLGGWLDTQIDQAGLLLIFVCVALRLGREMPEGLYWAVLTLATLVMVHMRAWMPWLLRHKEALEGLDLEGRRGPTGLGAPGAAAAPEAVAPSPGLFRVLLMQVQPHTHNVTLIVMLGLVMGRLDWMVVFLAAFITFWWIRVNAKVVRRLVAADRGEG